MDEETARERSSSDVSTVHEMGLGDLSDEDERSLLQTMYEDLEERTGSVLAGRVSDEQVEQFEDFVDSNDAEGAQAWQESSFPNYQATIASESDKLKVEVAENAGEILGYLQSPDEDSG